MNIVGAILERLFPGLRPIGWVKRTIIVVDKWNPRSIVRVGTVVGFMNGSQALICRDIDTDYVFAVKFSECQPLGNYTIICSHLAMVYQ